MRYEQAIYEKVRRESVAQVAYKVLCLDEIAPHKRHGRYYRVISAPELGLVLDVLKDRRSTDGQPVSCDEESQRCGHQGTAHDSETCR